MLAPPTPSSQTLNPQPLNPKQVMVINPSLKELLTRGPRVVPSRRRPFITARRSLERSLGFRDDGAGCRVQPPCVQGNGVYIHISVYIYLCICIRICICGRHWILIRCFIYSYNLYLYICIYATWCFRVMHRNL